MTNADELKLSVDERFDRFSRIQWWDQSRLAKARVLVIGAGALGNEVIKNLCLLGIGQLIVVDRDTIERSNLSRSILFRSTDEGCPKAMCAARAAAAIYPDIRVQPLTANVLSEVGVGYFRWADVVVGALDNREARVFVNSVCARLGKPWIDGGIEVFRGIVRTFVPPVTACYECTMSQVDWDAISQRRSCSLLARRAQVQGGTSTTPITASIVGALQAQEVVKLLHGLPALHGSGYVFDGAAFDSYLVHFPVNPACPWHDGLPQPVVPVQELTSASPLRAVWSLVEEQLGGLDALEMGRELVDTLRCSSCGKLRRLLVAADAVTEQDAVCSDCGTLYTPTFFHAVYRDSDLLDQPLSNVGLPRWDIVWGRYQDQFLGVEIAGDRPAALDDGADMPAGSVKSAEVLHHDSE